MSMLSFSGNLEIAKFNARQINGRPKSTTFTVNTQTSKTVFELLFLLFIVILKKNR